MSPLVWLVLFATFTNLDQNSDVTVLETLGGLLPGSTQASPHINLEDAEDATQAKRGPEAKGRRPPRFFVVVRFFPFW